MSTNFLFRFTGLAIISLASSLAAQASDFDVYIAPIGGVTMPLHSTENPFAGASALNAEPRFDFRFEAGKLNDHFSLDMRFGTRSHYTDFGGHARLFACLGYTKTLKLCSGAGVGATYSTGFISEPRERSFVDLQVEPFVRTIIDTKAGVGLIFEVAATGTPTRVYSTSSPVETDRRTKGQVKASFGLLLDWEKLEDPTNLDFTPSEALPEGYELFLFGVKGGLALTGLYSSGSLSEYRTGVLGGLSADLGRGRWGVSLDALYANRLLNSSASTVLNMERVEFVPQIRFRNIGSSFLLASLGGFVAVPMGDAVATTLNETTGAVTSSSSQKINMDYGVASSIGFGTRSEVVTLTMELRFGWGFAKIMNGTAAYSRPIDFLIGFQF